MTGDTPLLDHQKICEIPDCRNVVSKAKGICDECAIGGGPRP